MKRFAIIFGVLLTFLSCATFQKSRDENDADYIAGLIDSGNSQELSRLSAVPFLLDRDIVALGPDVAVFWDSLAKGGLRLGAVTLEAVIPVFGDGYKEFADTMEAKVFFSKYVGPGARILRLSAGSGGKLLLIVGSDVFSRKIYGFKGPF